MVDAIIIMGVAGCGKSSVGEELARRSDFQYFDGDDLHPEANIKKMSSGVPLNDDDRWPWLEEIGVRMLNSDQPLAIGCSALKRVYRERITQSAQKDVAFIHLSGSKELIAERMAARTKHFMPTTLLDSQFADLEPLSSDELGAEFGIENDLDHIVSDILTHLKG